MKRCISIFMVINIMILSFFVPAYAENGKSGSVPGIALSFEKASGIIVNLFAELFDKLIKTDEADIETAEPFQFSWEESDGNGFISEPEEVLTAQTWVASELTFVSNKEYADPFNDVDIDLQLYCDGKLFTVPGFWCGANIWKIRFVCPYEGEWLYKTVCTDTENSGLHGRTGKVVCSEYNGELDIYKHGFVTTSYGKKYFTYSDGTPFFYLGDTHWSLGDETVDMIKIICEKRAEQGFTVMQSEPIGAGFDVSDGVTEEDMQGFSVYDEKFEIIAENGFVHANAQFFFPYYMEVLINNFGGYSQSAVKAENGSRMYDFSDTVKHYLEKLSRYWVARYGAYPVMWTLGQEVDNDFYWSDSSHPDWNFINNPYTLVAEYIDKYDAYDQPLTAHQENAAGTVAYGNGENTGECKKIYKDGAQASAFRNVKAHSFYAAQFSPDKTGQSDFSVEKDYWYNSQGKPSVNYEGQYCYLWTKNFGARMQGWTAYLNGLYGYGWGGHDTWSYLNIFDEDTDSSDGVDTVTSAEKKAATWEDSLEYASSYQVGYMKNFFETSTRWFELIPRFDNRTYFVPCAKVYYTYAGNQDNSEIVIYFYSFSDSSVAENVNTKLYGGKLTGTVGNLIPKTEYFYQWFDPVTGEYSEKQIFTSSCFGTYFIGEKPTEKDMVILIKLSA